MIRAMTLNLPIRTRKGSRSYFKLLSDDDNQRFSSSIVLACSHASTVRWSVASFSGGVALLDHRLIVLQASQLGGRGEAPGA